MTKDMKSVFLAGVMASLPAGSAAAAEPAARAPYLAERAMIQVITPGDVPPVVKEDTEGDPTKAPSVHRRVVSNAKDGAVYLDVGYNTYAKGVGAKSSYAYTHDEICYIASGSIYAQSEGNEVVVGHGDYMWRPAGARTDETDVREPSVTICAFGPARVGDWAHKLPQEQIGTWLGKAEAKPRVLFRNIDEVEAESMAGGGATVRRVFPSGSGDNVYMSADQVDLVKGVVFTPEPAAADEVCFVESGLLTITSGDQTLTAWPNDFVYRPAGTGGDTIAASEATRIVCFYGPASKWQPGTFEQR